MLRKLLVENKQHKQLIDLAKPDDDVHAIILKFPTVPSRVRTLFQAKKDFLRTLTRNFKDFFNDNFTSKPRKMFVLTPMFWVYR